MSLINFRDNIQNDIACTVKVEINEKKYDDSSIYYYISYHTDEINMAHPFYDKEELMEHLEGDIIIKNSMTEKMIEYLLMDENELEKYSGNIRKKDLKIDSLYNTYKYHGLPPTPIALAGQEAIHAALHPKEGDALYFVSKNDGSHYFSKTLDEHNNAVRKYQLKK